MHAGPRRRGGPAWAPFYEMRRPAGRSNHRAAWPASSKPGSPENPRSYVNHRTYELAIERQTGKLVPASRMDTMAKRMAVVVHGGAGAPSTDADGCVRAAHAAIAAMRRGD